MWYDTDTDAFIMVTQVEELICAVNWHCWKIYFEAQLILVDISVQGSLYNFFYRKRSCNFEALVQFYLHDASVRKHSHRQLNIEDVLAVDEGRLEWDGFESCVAEHHGTTLHYTSLKSKFDNIENVFSNSTNMTDRLCMVKFVKMFWNGNELLNSHSALGRDAVTTRS